MEQQIITISKPLLSICIPTYNRAEYLKKSIESIICQDEFQNKKVEIVIADNASTDDTEVIVGEYTKRYDNILYYPNEKNIGNDNFPFVLSKGNGELKRLCNDTLYFNDGSLKYICDIVDDYSKNRPFICWLDSNGNDDITECDFRTGVRKISYWMTSIASFSIWDNECYGIENDTFGAELLLWQVRKTLELSSQKNKMVIINKDLTYVQPVNNKNISYGLYHVFYENYFTLLNPYFENGKLTENDKEYLEKDLLLNFFPDWCVRWKLQNTTLQYSKTEDLNKSIYQQFHDKPYWKNYKIKYVQRYIKLKLKYLIKKLIRKG